MNKMPLLCEEFCQFLLPINHHLPGAGHLDIIKYDIFCFVSSVGRPSIFVSSLQFIQHLNSKLFKITIELFKSELSLYLYSYSEKKKNLYMFAPS